MTTCSLPEYAARSLARSTIERAGKASYPLVKEEERVVSKAVREAIGPTRSICVLGGFSVRYWD